MHWHLLTAALLVAAPAPAEEKKDKDLLQGEWTVVSMERGGKQAPEEEVKKIKFAVKDDTITVNDGRKDEAAKFKIDAGKKPKTIDIMPEPDEKKVLGIYELKGDELKICFTKGGGERPTEFATKADSEQVLIVFKRAKKNK